MRRGHLSHGLGKTAAIWLAVVLLALLVPRAAVLWSGIGAALLASVLLGKWHARRQRADTAVGAFTGVVLWPALIGVAIIAINAVSASLSPYE